MANLYFASSFSLIPRNWPSLFLVSPQGSFYKGFMVGFIRIIIIILNYLSKKKLEGYSKGTIYVTEIVKCINKNVIFSLFQLLLGNFGSINNTGIF